MNKKELQEIVKRVGLTKDKAEKSKLLKVLMKASKENLKDNDFSDLSKVRNEIDKLKFELERLNKTITQFRTESDKARIRELQEIIEKAELKFSLDKANLRNKKAGIIFSQDGKNFTGLQKKVGYVIETIKRPKMKTNNFDELIPIRKNGQIVYETIKRKVWKGPKCTELEKRIIEYNNKVITDKKTYNKINEATKLNKVTVLQA